MITDRIFEWAHVQPQRPAILEGSETITYLEFANIIEAARSYFAAFDLPRGQFAFVFTRTGAEHWVLTLALRALGLHTATVPNLTDIAALKLKDVACIVCNEECLPGPGTLPTALREARIIPVTKKLLMRGLASAPPRPSSNSTQPGGYLLRTSGTTGIYKNLLGGGAPEADIVRWNLRTLHIDRNTIYHMLSFPPWTGIGAVTATVWHAGGCLAFSGVAEPYADFFRHRPTHAMVVPFMLPPLLASRPAGEGPRASLTLTVTGGFLPLVLAERVTREITPNVEIYYGSTEVCAFMRARFQSNEDLYWLEPEGRIEVVDDEDRHCLDGVEGEIRIGLMPFDTDHYLDDSAATARHFRDGWFYPGDAAIRRKDGRIRVLGRIEDAINIKGVKIPVAPLEEKIQRALSVAHACVFSRLNAAAEEEILIAVESVVRPSDETLANAILGIRGFDRVRWTFLDRFPRTEGGLTKTNRRKLRKLLE